MSTALGVLCAITAIILVDNWRTRRAVRNMCGNLDERLDGWIHRADELLERLDDS